MTCREFAEFMADYRSGDLSAEARARFDEHMALCPDCVTYLKGYEAAIRLGRHAWAPESPVPEDVPETLVQAILAARQRKWA